MRNAILIGVSAIMASTWTSPVTPATHDRPAATAQSTETAVVERTRLKANPGDREALGRFIVANWFAMDEVAVRKGLFTSYRLLENSDTDGDWDWVVEVGYPNPDGYSNPEVQARFQAIREQHETVLIDGKSLRDLGRVIGTERLSLRAGSY